jgi:hypothetical protein
MVKTMTHFDLVSGRPVEVRPHPHMPWERWTVGTLMPHVAELERDMTVEYAIECVGAARVFDALVASGKDPATEEVVTFRLLAIRLPDGRLTDESGHNIEMREVAS